MYEGYRITRLEVQAIVGVMLVHLLANSNDQRVHDVRIWILVCVGCVSLDMVDSGGIVRKIEIHQSQMELFLSFGNR